MMRLAESSLFVFGCYVIYIVNKDNVLNLTVFAHWHKHMHFPNHVNILTWVANA